MSKREGPVHVAVTRRHYKGKTYETTLLRRTYRQDGKVKNQTLGNLSHLPAHTIELVRRSLAGESFVPASDWTIRRSLPHGNVACVLGTLRALGLERLIDRSPSPERDRAVAMIASRILAPGSKLATTRQWDQSTLGSSLGVSDASEDDLYRAMDWLLERQPKVEKALAARHLSNGSLVLYDLSSSYMEGTHCALAKRGYSRDGKKNTLQIEYGLLTDAEGRPVSVEVFAGNTSDPTTVAAQVEKLTTRFGLQEMVVVGDRGMITTKNIAALRTLGGVSWVTALRHAQLRSLLREGAFQLTLFEESDLAEIYSPEYPNERLVVCRNPSLKEQVEHTRESLLQATEEKLRPIQEAVRTGRLTAEGKIGLTVGRVINARKVARYFTVVIGPGQLSITRKADVIADDARLDGIYAVRTSVPATILNPGDVVRTYKRLQHVERAFRHFKSTDLLVRPVHHCAERRVRAHLFLCMLAYYVQWEMERCWAPLLFRDDDPQPQENPVRAAPRTAPPTSKEGVPTHSFATLLSEMATLTRNSVASRVTGQDAPFDIIATPTSLQTQALDLLSVSLSRL